MDFLVMEFLDGETLERRLEKGPLPPEQTIRYGAQIANALAKAHKLGITHRDLKPANVMLTKAGAKLLDFGLAMQSGPAPLANALTQMTQEQSKLTSAGMVVGTFHSMAPSTLAGKPAAVVSQPKLDWKFWGMVAIALLAVATLLFHFLSQPASQSSVRMRWVISPPEGTQFLATGDAPAPVAISPDGRRIAFVAGSP